jgi:GNAT superfamily N-acetyltransferase
MMGISIRKAEIIDAASIAEIIRSLGWFAHVNAETPDETRSRVTRHLELCLADDSHSVYVAQVPASAENLTEKVVGYVAVHWLPYLLLAGAEGYVSELFIRESERGLGIGTQLLAMVEAEAARRGCTRLMLLNMRQRESYQREFYIKHGWEERPEAANFVRYL